MPVVSGPLIDIWCWTDNNKVALDTNSKLDRNPEEHTVHCMYDVDFCKDSGFIIVKNHPDEDPPYKVENTLDAAGNQMVIEKLKNIPSAATGCVAEVTGTVSNSTTGIDGSKIIKTSAVEIQCSAASTPTGLGVVFTIVLALSTLSILF